MKIRVDMLDRLSNMRVMDTKSDIWKTVSRIGLAHGLSHWAIRKWASRGVPTKWQIVIVKETGGVISFEDFKKMKRGEPA